MIKPLTFAALLLVAAPAAAQESAVHGAFAIMNVLKESECIFEGTTEQLFSENGITDPQMAADVLDYFMKRELMAIEFGRVELSTDMCPEHIPALMENDVENFAAVFASFNCTLAASGERAVTKEAATALFAEAGFDQRRVARMMDYMLELGAVTADRATDGVTILPPYCVPESDGGS